MKHCGFEFTKRCKFSTLSIYKTTIKHIIKEKIIVRSANFFYDMIF